MLISKFDSRARTVSVCECVCLDKFHLPFSFKCNVSHTQWLQWDVFYNRFETNMEHLVWDGVLEEASRFRVSGVVVTVQCDGPMLSSVSRDVAFSIVLVIRNLKIGVWINILFCIKKELNPLIVCHRNGNMMNLSEVLTMPVVAREIVISTPNYAHY